MAQTRDEADRLALPQLLAMVALRTGAPLTPQRLVEEAEKVDLPDAAPRPAVRHAVALGDR